MWRRLGVFGALIIYLGVSQAQQQARPPQAWQAVDYEPSAILDIDGRPLSYDAFAPVGLLTPRIGKDKIIGQAWGDYNRDGWLDLYVTDSRGPNTLFINQQGTLVISPISEQVALGAYKSSGAIFADYNNDGWPDLYILNDGQPNVLFRNERGVSFSDVTRAAGVGDKGHGRTASWGDYDNDGWLDLYVANWSCSPHCGHPSLGDRDTLYHNNGDGTFSDVTHLLNDKVYGAGFAASWTDYDNDGDLDLYLVNDEFINPVGNALWRNDGIGCAEWCFSEISGEVGANTRVMGMGIAVGDFDNDLDLDFYFSNVGPSILLQNNSSQGYFSDIAHAVGANIAGTPIGWGAIMFDYDNDGWRDIYLGITESLPNRSNNNPLFRNIGGRFERIATHEHQGRTMGVAYADYDNDGWIDFVVGDYDRGYWLYHNELWRKSNHHRISFRLHGGGSVNHDAVGSRVIVTDSEGRSMLQDVQSGGSLGAGNSMVLHFGLGNAHVHLVTIIWADGRQQQFDDIVADKNYEIHYPIGSP